MAAEHKGLGENHDWENMPVRDMDGGAFHCQCECCQGECDACLEENHKAMDEALKEESEYFDLCLDMGMAPHEAQSAVMRRFYGDEADDEVRS